MVQDLEISVNITTHVITGGPPPTMENSNGCAGNSGVATLMKVEEEEGPSRRNLDTVTEKPPNVLVYAANKTEYFNAVQDTLSQCLNADRYYVYHYYLMMYSMVTMESLFLCSCLMMKFKILKVLVF